MARVDHTPLGFHSGRVTPSYQLPFWLEKPRKPSSRAMHYYPPPAGRDRSRSRRGDDFLPVWPRRPPPPQCTGRRLQEPYKPPPGYEAPAPPSNYQPLPPGYEVPSTIQEMQRSTLGYRTTPTGGRQLPFSGYSPPPGYDAPHDQHGTHPAPTWNLQYHDLRTKGSRKGKGRTEASERGSKWQRPPSECQAPSSTNRAGTGELEGPTDIEEQGTEAQRDAGPEPTRGEKPLQLLKERTSNPEAWRTGVVNEHLRSWMYITHEKGVTTEDFEELQSKVDWLKLMGGSRVIRKTKWFVKAGCRCPYNYGKQKVEAEVFPDWLWDMSRRWLRSLNLDGADQNSVMPDCVNLNLYEHGSHTVAWHADDEPLFQSKVEDARIISVSLGSPRSFQIGLRAPRQGGILRPVKGSVESFSLEHGHLCTMEGVFQKHYLHQVAKSGANQLRINATFRYIVKHDNNCPMRWVRNTV